MDEDRGRPRLRVHRRREPADVPAVAGGQQRQHPDARVLGRVQGAGQVSGLQARRLTDLLRDCPPHGGGGQHVLVHLQSVLGDDLPSRQRHPLVAGHLTGDLHRTEGPGDRRRARGLVPVAGG